jgi:hypothetical protein
MLTEEFLNGEFYYINFEFLGEISWYLSATIPAELKNLGPWTRDFNNVGVLYAHWSPSSIRLTLLGDAGLAFSVLRRFSARSVASSNATQMTAPLG